MNQPAAEPLVSILLDSTNEYISAITNKLDLVLKGEEPALEQADQNQSPLIRRLRSINTRLSTLLDTIDL